MKNDIKSFEMKISKKVRQTVHQIRTSPEFFQQIWTGEKPFEVRMHDRSFKIGDRLWFQEWDNAHGTYTGRECTVVVTSVVSNPDVCKEGFVILGFPPANKYMMTTLIGRGKAEISSFVVKNPDCFNQFLSKVNSTPDGEKRSHELAIAYLTEHAHGISPITVPPIYAASEFIRLMEKEMLAPQNWI